MEGDEHRDRAKVQTTFTGSEWTLIRPLGSFTLSAYRLLFTVQFLTSHFLIYSFLLLSSLLLISSSHTFIRQIPLFSNYISSPLSSPCPAPKLHCSYSSSGKHFPSIPRMLTMLHYFCVTSNANETDSGSQITEFLLVPGSVHPQTADIDCVSGARIHSYDLPGCDALLKRSPYSSCWQEQSGGADNWTRTRATEATSCPGELLWMCPHRFEICRKKWKDRASPLHHGEYRESISVNIFTLTTVAKVQNVKPWKQKLRNRWFFSSGRFYVAQKKQ